MVSMMTRAGFPDRACPASFQLQAMIDLSQHRTQSWRQVVFQETIAQFINPRGELFVGQGMQRAMAIHRGEAVQDSRRPLIYRLFSPYLKNR